MKKTIIKIIVALLSLFIIFVFILPQFGISIPQMVVSQEDIQPSELNAHTLEKKVLIAARSSDFKNAVIDNIKNSLKNDSIYIKCIGLSNLNNEDTSPFNAIVLVNTIMAWNWDLNVKRFLKQRDDVGNVIILSTSGSGDWKPRRKDHQFDAITSASEDGNAEGVADDIVVKIRKRILNSIPLL